MITRRRFLTGAAATAGAVATGVGLSGCSGGSTDSNHVTLWGVGGDSREIEQKVIDAFTKDNPGVTIESKNVPSNGTGDATSVITAVRGKTAPDLWWMDRFAGAQYAALGLLEPIDDLVAEYESDDFLDGWLPFAVDELRYQGKLYGLPTSTDVRGLYYNKTLLKQVGVDPDELDMSNGPIQLDRLTEIGNKINKTDKVGNYQQMGFIPWHGQGSGYTWSMGTHASWFDEAACEMTINSDKVRQAYQISYDYARKFDYSRIDAFIASYEPSNAPPGQSAFNSGKLGLGIETSGNAHTITKYAPKIEWGYGYLPILSEGDDPYTWSGGFALVMPKGSSRSKAAWDFMKFYAGQRGQSIYCPPTYALPTRKDVLEDPGLKALRQQIAQLKYSTSRPPIPVGALWWDAQAQVMSTITIGSSTPEVALQNAQDQVGPQMKTYCPFKLPSGFGKTGF